MTLRLPAFLQSPPQRFLWIMLASALVYGAMLCFYGADAHHQTRLARELFIWPVIIALLGLYVAGYQALKASGRFQTHFLVISVALVALAATAIQPFHSTDLYGYVNRGWQQVAYHANPYVWTVDQIAGWTRDPMFTNHWVNNPCPYGFLFALTAKALCYAGAGHLNITTTLFKSANLLAHLAIGLLIWLSARRLGDAAPERASYLYLANPLILLHHLANGHNDILMAFFLTLAAFTLVRGWRLLTLPCLVAATLIKYSAILAIPFALMVIIRHGGWREALKGVLLGFLLALAIASPYVIDLPRFPWGEMGVNASISHNSLHSVIFTLYKVLAGWIPAWQDAREMVKASLKAVLVLAFAGFYGWRLSLAWKDLRGAETLQAARRFAMESLLTMLVAVGLASAKFYAWYLGMFLPLAFFLSPRDELRRLTLTLAGAQLFGLTFLGQAHVLNFLLLSAAPVFPFVWRRLRPATSPALETQAS